MKALAAFTILFCGLALGPSTSAAQSITINSVSATSFCTGDPVSVNFTASGFGGNRNAFMLQLSNPNGSFANGFQNIGSVVDTVSGTFTVNTKIPHVGPSTHYRLRILAASTTSVDNGSDLAIGGPPGYFIFQNYVRGVAIGTPITFTATGDLNAVGYLQDTGFWDFGSGATPAKVTAPATVRDFNMVSFSQTASYSTTGNKTVALSILKPGGCPAMPITPYMFHVYDCSIPSISHDAVVVYADTTRAKVNTAYWVNPGAKFIANTGDTIFAEPGSTISGLEGDCVIYLKSGAVLNSTIHGGTNSVIFGNGASANAESDDFTLNCPALTFDYTNAPPNKAFQGSGVDKNAVARSISITPNPTIGSISISGIPENVMDISVLNLLGETETTIAKPTSNMQVDLSTLSPGVYYVRFSMPGAVVTKKMVKE